MQRSALAIVVVAIVVIVAGVLYLAVRPAVPAPGEAEQVSAPVEPVRVARELTIPVTVTQQFMSPGELAVYEGDTVTLQLQSADVPHVVQVESYDVQQTVPVGEVASLTFVPRERGQIRVLCVDQCEPSSVLTVTVT